MLKSKPFLLYLNSRGISNGAAEKAMILGNGTLGKAFKREYLTENIIEKIRAIYPDYNEKNYVNDPTDESMKMENEMLKKLLNEKDQQLSLMYEMNEMLKLQLGIKTKKEKHS